MDLGELVLQFYGLYLDRFGGEAGDELGRQPGSRCLRTAILISWAGDLKHVASYELVAASQETSEEDEEGF